MAAEILCCTAAPHRSAATILLTLVSCDTADTGHVRKDSALVTEERVTAASNASKARINANDCAED